MSTPPPASSDHPQLDALIAAYLEAVERGEAPDRDQLIAANADLAGELRAFFMDLDRVSIAARKATEQEGAPTVIRPNTDPSPDTLIGGKYKLLENIGEGGMGSVWVATQLHPVKRKVAIKLIKPGMDSKQVLARFEAERQALAVMDHPNIAKVFDGGLTEQGRPYFVMEYVKGVPFTDYCDKARLPLNDRLKLFIAVCSAVQHAHHKGIVHRDLKPSNILICLYDGVPVPKVIDFGLAKAMHQPLTEASIFTGHGVMVGTPLYMSPEQAEHNNLDVDTRTDIYSLGVVLYELLTGTTPLERQQLKDAAFHEMLRLIKEVEPPRPSTRLSSNASLPSIAAQRSIDPKQLSRSLSGDLDWVAMKALEKERSRRYETANGLARDIERFLNEEPVEACPPSTMYRLKKYIKRHKAPVTAAALVVLTLIGGIIGTSWGLRKAKLAEVNTSKALDQVKQERDAKEVDNERLLLMWENIVNELMLSQNMPKSDVFLVDSQLFESFSAVPLSASEANDAGATAKAPMRLKFVQNKSALGDAGKSISHMEVVILEAIRCQRQHMIGIRDMAREKLTSFISKDSSEHLADRVNDFIEELDDEFPEIPSAYTLNRKAWCVAVAEKESVESHRTAVSTIAAALVRLS